MKAHLLTATLLLLSINAQAKKDPLNQWLKAATSAAEGGNVDSMAVLATYYGSNMAYSDWGFQYGTYGASNEAAAFEWAKKGALRNDPRCTFLLGRYSGRVATYVSARKAAYDSVVYYYKKAAAMGYAPAMYELADMAMPKEGTRDVAEATKWYRMAADKGYAPAIKKLSEMEGATDHPLEKGDAAFAKGNMQEAARWYRIAGDNNKDQVAMYKLGMMYLNGPLTPKGESFDWFMRSAELGYGPARYEVGNDYYRMSQNDKVGFGDMEKAISWWQRSDDPRAVAKMAEINAHRQQSAREIAEYNKTPHNDAPARTNKSTTSYDRDAADRAQMKKESERNQKGVQENGKAIQDYQKENERRHEQERRDQYNRR